MAAAFSRLIKELQARTPTVRGEAHEEWNSLQPCSRAVIRQAIRQTLKDLNAHDMQALGDLTEPPRPFHWSLSISHCPTLGGWLAVPRPMQIGFDVEIKARINTAVIKRISSQEEINQAPQAGFLWCAKEAYYKALEDEQPQTVSQLTVTAWRAQGPGLWRWDGLGARNCEGLLLDSGAELIAISLIS